MTNQQITQNLIQALKELLPKHQYKEFPGFKDNIAKLEDAGFQLKHVYSDNPHDKESPRYWGYWNQKIQEAGEKKWKDGHVSKIKALDFPVGRLKEIINLWVFKQADYALTIRNSYDLAVYDRKAKGWEGYFHIVILFYVDKKFGALPSDKDLIDNNNKLKEENKMLEKKLGQLEVKVKNMVEENNQLKEELESKTSYIKSIEKELKEAGGTEKAESFIDKILSLFK